MAPGFTLIRVSDEQRFAAVVYLDLSPLAFKFAGSLSSRLTPLSPPHPLHIRPLAPFLCCQATESSPSCLGVD